MKRHSYGKLISMSWGWMAQILFRPFSLKKWIMLGIIILLAGQMSGGCNINLKGDRADFKGLMSTLGKKAPVIKKLSLPQDIVPQPDIVPQAPSFQVPPVSKDRRAVASAIAIAAFIILFIGIFVLLWIWLSSNFSFVFIDSIMRNDASLRVPFHRNKAQGNSYFRWNVVLTLIGLLVLGGIISLPVTQLIKAGAFSGSPPLDVSQILSVTLRYVPILLATGILFSLITFFTTNFVLPIMYRKRIGILKAWRVFLGLLRKNIWEIIKYIFVRIGLFILTLIALVILGIIGIIALLLIGLLIGLLGWLIYAITPTAAKPVITGVLAIIGIPIFIFLGFLFNLIFLPIPVFFRTFSIHVLGSMDESLDLFAPKTPEEITAEGDDAKYRKSMRLVWFMVLFPVLAVLVALLLAVAIPNFVKGRQKALWFQKAPKMPAIPTGEEVLQRGIVTVYLKNGNTFEAEIERESERNISFKVRGGTFILPRSDILRIER